MANYISLDVGGSHISSALISNHHQEYNIEFTEHRTIRGDAAAEEFIQQLTESIKKTAESTPEVGIHGVAISMPGPMMYEHGISKIAEVNKFEALFGLDLKTTLAGRLSDLKIGREKITFINDGQAFLLGVINRKNLTSEKVLALCVGTGLGSASYAGGSLYSGLLDENYLYNTPFKDGRAEDYFSTEWFLGQAMAIGLHNGEELKGVKNLAQKWNQNEKVRSVFQEFGKNLAEYLNDLLPENELDRIVFGGSIFQSYSLFENTFTENFSRNIEVDVANNTRDYSMIGAAVDHRAKTEKNGRSFRKSASPVLPVKKEKPSKQSYDIYPAFSLEEGEIREGYQSLSEFINGLPGKKLMIDGNVGTRWDDFVSRLNREFTAAGKKVCWFHVDAALKEEDEIFSMLEGYLGGNDPLFGFRYSGKLRDFFDDKPLKKITSCSETVSILYGTGAALAGWDAPVIYVDLPKNEIQYRSRAGSVTNIGAQKPDHPKKMYKRFYFVDWPVCNRHKSDLIPKLSALVDGQRPNTVTWTSGEDFRRGLQKMAKSPFRVRPWFEPGVWGGRWMQEYFEGLNPEAENFAWSFEIIAPENGIILESDGRMLEAGFEFLMAADNEAILGSHANIYGQYFPIRFDYLDTMGGENLSLQCHPRLEYIREQFGEQITQDETYYMMKAKPGAEVYLGFQEDIDPGEFEQVFRECEKSGKKADTERFVQHFEAKKHDLFLIPAGTIHCSGKDNLVLEISNTPYIFTFKIYDWQRLDLNGKPRTLNVDRAFENLDFDRKGRLIEEEFISKPEVLDRGEDWALINLPTHEEHLYAIHRIEFENSVHIATENRFHVLNLVEGASAEIITEQHTMAIHYGETVVIPAAAGAYTLKNRGEQTAKMVKAFMK